MENKTETENIKDYKEERINNNNKKECEKMGIFGLGRGYFGLPKNANYSIRLIIIILFFAGMGLFLFSINQLWAGLISFGVGFMFILFNNLVRD